MSRCRSHPLARTLEYRIYEFWSISRGSRNARGSDLDPSPHISQRAILPFSYRKFCGEKRESILQLQFPFEPKRGDPWKLQKDPPLYLPISGGRDFNSRDIRRGDCYRVRAFWSRHLLWLEVSRIVQEDAWSRGRIFSYLFCLALSPSGTLAPPQSNKSPGESLLSHFIQLCRNQPRNTVCR